MHATEVAAYLQANPDFFTQYADLLAEIVVPHPHAGHAIALSERQLISLRDRNQRLGRKFAELIQFGEQNDLISERIHQFSLALFNAIDGDDLLATIGYHLRQHFLIKCYALRLWDTNIQSCRVEFNEVTPELKALAANLTVPYCGSEVNPEVSACLGEAADECASFALVALQHPSLSGLLMLASEDEQRFYPQMGTLYLERLGELCSAAIARQFAMA